MKRIAYRLVIMYLPFMLMGCFGRCGEDDDYYNTQDRKEIVVQSADNTAETTVVTNKDSIPARAYAIAVSLKDTVLLGLENSNVACGTRAVYQRQITSLTIQSLSDFDATHPASTPLNDYFKVRDRYRSREHPQPIDAKSIEQINRMFEPQLFLYQLPSSVRSHQFVVTMGLSDGSKMIDTTRTIWLTL